MMNTNNKVNFPNYEKQTSKYQYILHIYWLNANLLLISVFYVYNFQKDKHPQKARKS